MQPRRPFSIFRARLWAFLNYHTRIGLTWLELLSAMLAGMLLVWVGLRDWVGSNVLGPLAIFILIFGFQRARRYPVGWVRALYFWVRKPLQIEPQPRRKYEAYALVVGAELIALLLVRLDARLALAYSLALGFCAALLFCIHAYETAGGKTDLDTIASRMPTAGILRDGEIVHRDGTRARISIILSGRSGYKPALQEVDVADLLTKMFAHLAQHEGGGIPIKLFWLADYHLGQLDLPENDQILPEYVEALSALAETGGRKARVVITGIVYPAEEETQLRDWLTQLDYRLAPLGAYAVESLARMIFHGESFLAQIQDSMLNNGKGLPRAAYRGYAPAALTFDDRVRTDRQQLTVVRVNTPFPDAREALMRALNTVDGLMTVAITPLPRGTTATELRGQLLAARVPGFGRGKEARQLRDVLHRLEDPRGLEYLFETRTHFITWGKDEGSAQTNQATAEAYLTALNLTPLARRELEDSLPEWLMTIAMPRVKNFAARVMDWIAAPPRAPAIRLLSSQVISTLAREEGSDLYLADARGRILLGRSVSVGKEGLRYADFRSDTGPTLLVGDQGGGKTSTLIVWFIMRLRLLNYKIVAVNLKYSTRMQLAVEKIGGIVLHPHDNLPEFEQSVRAALASDRALIYQPVKGTRLFAIADDPCLAAFMKIFYEEWLPHRTTPAALAIDEIHRLMPKDSPLSANAAATATLVAEAFKDWAERKLVIAAATQTLQDLLGSNLGIALQKFRTVAYFQVGREDREMLIEKGYEPALVELIAGARRRPRGYCLLVLPDGFYTTMKVLVTPEEREIIQRLDVEETADTTPQLTLR